MDNERTRTRAFPYLVGSCSFLLVTNRCAKIVVFGDTNYVEKAQNGATNGFWSILTDFEKYCKTVDIILFSPASSELFSRAMISGKCFRIQIGFWWRSPVIAPNMIDVYFQIWCKDTSYCVIVAKYLAGTCSVSHTWFLERNKTNPSSCICLALTERTIKSFSRLAPTL